MIAISIIIAGFITKIYLVGVGLILFFLYPLLLELLINIWGYFSFSEEKEHKAFLAKKLKMTAFIGIVYSPKYNITCCGLESLHPFDSVKYRRIMKILKPELEGQNLLNKKIRFWEPDYPTRGFLLQYVSKCHLFLLNYSIYICKIIEVPLFFLPSFMLSSVILNPMLKAVQGTVDSVAMMFVKGFAINISGGYHHAHYKCGGGFCVYPDITMAIKEARKHQNIKKAMIIDLDAHMGNGHERDFMNDDDCYIIDFYNPNIYPMDDEVRAGIQSEVFVTFKDDDKSYLQKMEETIPKALDVFKPEIVLYNAGTDCMKGDPLGHLNITAEGIIKRDELVFKYCRKRNIPVLMVLSGGYQKENAPCIAESIINLYRKFDLK